MAVVSERAQCSVRPVFRTRTRSEGASRRALASMALTLIVPCACGGEEPPAPAVLRFLVSDAASGSPLTGAEITLEPGGEAQSTDGAGQLQLEVAPGSYRFRVQAAGHLPAPRPLGPAAIAVAVQGQTVEVLVPLDPRPGAVAGGTIRGRVTLAGAPAEGVLVVAAATTHFSAFTDAAGTFRLLGVAPNTYRVQAYRGGHVSTLQDRVQIAAGGEVDGVALELTPEAGASLGGAVGEGTGTTSVAITLEATGDLIPGLAVLAPFGGAWSATGVPPGRYRVRAFLERDGRVLDPELLRNRAEPVIEVSGAGPFTVDLPTAPAVEGLSFSETSTRGARLAWAPVPGADFYVVEVQNLAGQTLWGGFDAQRRPLLRVLAPDTEIMFGTTVAPLEMLQPGVGYRMRVFAGIEVTTGTLFELSAASEENDGFFRARR